MIALLRDLAARRELLLSLVKRDLKVRYKDSLLGFLWSLGRPLFLMIILSVVFGTFMKIPYAYADAVPYPLFLITGILPWMFLASSLAESTGVLIGNASLIKKVSINTAVFPAANVLSNLVHLFLAGIVYVAFLLYFGVGFHLTTIWMLVPALVLQTLLVLALCLLTSVLNVLYRDVASLVEILLNAWFYVTPVLYPIGLATGQIHEKMPGWARVLEWLYLANPMAAICALYRRALLFDGTMITPDAATGAAPFPAYEMGDGQLALSVALATITTFVLLAVASAVFARFSPRVADRL